MFKFFFKVAEDGEKERKGRKQIAQGRDAEDGETSFQVRMVFFLAVGVHTHAWRVEAPPSQGTPLEQDQKKKFGLSRTKKRNSNRQKKKFTHQPTVGARRRASPPARQAGLFADSSGYDTDLPDEVQQGLRRARPEGAESGSSCFDAAVGGASCWS